MSDYKKTIIVKNEEAAIQYKVIITGKDSGSYQQGVIKAIGPNWTESFKDQSLCTIKDYDGILEITIHKPNKPEKTINLTISDLADLRTLIEVMSKTNKVPWFSKLKITKKLITRKLK